MLQGEHSISLKKKAIAVVQRGRGGDGQKVPVIEARKGLVYFGRSRVWLLAAKQASIDDAPQVLPQDRIGGDKVPVALHPERAQQKNAEDDRLCSRIAIQRAPS